MTGLTEGVWTAESILGSAQVEALQPSSDGRRRDIWWSVVAAEVVVIMVDLFHMLELFLCLWIMEEML